MTPFIRRHFSGFSFWFWANTEDNLCYISILRGFPASGCPHWPCRWSKFSAKKLWTLFVVDSKNVPFYVFCNLSCNFHRRDCQNWSPPCPKYWPTFFMVRRRYRLKCIAVVLTSLQFENKSRYGQLSKKNLTCHIAKLLFALHIHCKISLIILLPMVTEQN